MTDQQPVGSGAAQQTPPPAPQQPGPSDPQSQDKESLSLKTFWNAFKNFAIVFSFIVNFVLILVLLFSPRIALQANSLVAEPLLVNLDQAFAALGETNIESVVYINDTMPVVFDLPLNQNTDVILQAPVPLQAPATFLLPGGGGSINGTVMLNLPEGMALPVALNMMVPVSTTVPVVMEVPVSIPLAEAGMAPAIHELRGVFLPLSGGLQNLPEKPVDILRPGNNQSNP